MNDGILVMDSGWCILFVRVLGRLVWLAVARSGFSHSSLQYFLLFVSGIRRLLGNAYDAAFPLHDVIYIFNLFLYIHGCICDIDINSQGAYKSHHRLWTGHDVCDRAVS